MPISLSCPHCGKFLNVGDQYAGQTGPCPACGQAVHFPSGNIFASAPVGPVKSGSGTTTIVIILTVLLVFCVLGCGCLVALMLPAVQAARESARRVQSINNIKMIGLAMHNYHDTYGQLPPAVVRDADGKPLYSGRVLLLPFLDQSAVAKQWDHAQAWDSPANKDLAAMSIKVFTDPSVPVKAGQSPAHYLFVTGQGTCFEEGVTTKFADVTDGLSNTMYLIETQGAGVSWAEPNDFDVTQGLPTQGHRRGTFLVGLLDGSVAILPAGTPPATLRALSTRDGGETINLP